MHLTLETDNNLIINEYLKDEYADFLSQKSLSEHGFAIPDVRRINDNALPPPNSKDEQLSFMISPITSPNFAGSKTNEILLVKTPI